AWSPTSAATPDAQDPASRPCLGAGRPFHLGGITPYLDRSGIAEKVTGTRFRLRPTRRPAAAVGAEGDGGTAVFALCDNYVTRWAALDPVAAGMQGITGSFGAATDYSPDGFAARAELIASTLAELEGLGVISVADRLAAGFLRERLEARLAWH